MIEKEVLEQVFSEVTNPNGSKYKIITGLETVDTFLENYKKHCFITIGARPAMGKTAFASSILINFLKRNKNCLVFSNKMCKTNYIKRLITQVSDITAPELRKNQNEHNIPVLKIRNALDKISRFKLTINEEYVDISDIQNQIEIIKPDYVFIDDLYMLADKINMTNLKKLKQIAQDNNCIIFAISGLTRATESQKRKDKRPILSDLISAKDIVNISDVIMLIYRRCFYFGPDINKKNPNIEDAEIIFAKNTGGLTGSANLVFNNESVKFSDPIINDVY